MKMRHESLPGRGGGATRLLLALAFAAAILLLAISALARPAEAQATAVDRVQDGRTIEAFIGTDLVGLTGYPANRQVTLEVVRNGVVVGSVTARTDATGFLEINHGGGGQFPAGDCFAPPVTPDIRPGDTIRTTTVGDARGVRDFAVVRDLGIDFENVAVNQAAGTITVSGHARSLANAPINPGDVLELRLNKGNAENRWDVFPGGDQDRPNRRDLRVDIGENLDAAGNFTRTLNVGQDDAADWNANPGEISLEWSAAPAAGEGEEVDPPAIFVADEAGGEALLGCPPVADYAVTSSNPKVVNKAFVDGTRNLVVGGISLDASAVSVTLDDRNAATAPRVVNATLSGATGSQTWRANFTNEQVSSLRDGTLTARATYTTAAGTRTGPNLNIAKDTVAPATPRATPAPGTYPRTQLVTLSAQAGTRIHYTTNGTRPTLNSPVFTRQIRVATTRTIRAIAADRAGNTSAVGSFRYVIR